MDCPGMPEIGVDEWAKSLLGPSGPERLPLVGSLELTYRCNLDCIQCYCNLPVGDRAAQAQELSLSEMHDVLDQIAEEGCLSLLITGGEPLVRSDFLDIYAYAKSKGMLISLFTNGTLLTARIADYLAEWPPRRVEITLYGMTAETFESVTRVPGSFERCMRGIELLMERDIPLGLKTTVTTLNKEELWDVKRYAEGLGLDYRFDAVLHARYDGSKTPHEVRLSPEEVVQLDLADEERSRRLKELCERSWGAPTTDNLYLCGAGQHMFHIDSCGLLSPCMISRAHTYDLRQGSFSQGWRDYLLSVRSLQVQRAVRCRTCEEKSLCSQCPATSYLEEGDPESPIGFACELSHLRAEAFREGYIREEQTDERRRRPEMQEAL
jgi:radical SAM protein with 4Fe4S-binding SPASM domain